MGIIAYVLYYWSMNILENIELKPFTSMYVGGLARFFVEVSSKSELIEALNFAKEKGLTIFIFGGGSNIIVSDLGFDGLVIKMSIFGKDQINETDEYAEYEIGAGESWDEFVKFAVHRGFYGIENLSHIPGTVGASVVQNIGAYGQEVSHSVVVVKVVEVDTNKEEILKNSDLDFSYRKSILNSSKKGKYIVTSVIFRLNKKGEINLAYDDLKKYFALHKDKNLDLISIREAIIEIRDSKFPFPDSPKNGTVGSFFNAEAVDLETYENIVKKLKEKGFEEKASELINKKSAFTVSQGFKVPYGILAEVLGFKGKVYGGARILPTHSAVINNFSGLATANDILLLSKEVVDSVYKEFGVKLKIEPELVGDFKFIS